MGVKAWAVEEEVFDGFRYSLAPGAVWVRGQTQAMQVSSESGVAQLETSEGCRIQGCRVAGRNYSCTLYWPREMMRRAVLREVSQVE